MFRKLTRVKQQLSQQECKEILRSELRGVLALCGDDGYPYAVPINFYYDENENAIYFHSGKSGHKMDAIRRCDKASFCVCDKGKRKDGHWSLNFKSVIAFGKVEVVENWSKDLMVEFCKRFTTDTDYIDNEIARFGNATAVLRLNIEHVSGKTVNEA